MNSSEQVINLAMAEVKKAIRNKELLPCSSQESIANYLEDECGYIILPREDSATLKPSEIARIQWETTIKG